LESKVKEGMQSEILLEIESSEKDYDIIKNFLRGVEYDSFQIRTTLQSFKDRLSRVRSLIIAYFQMQGKSFDFQTRPILDSIDMALVLMEVKPQCMHAAGGSSVFLCLAVCVLEVFCGVP